METKKSIYLWLMVGIFQKLVIVWTRWGTKTLKSGSVGTQELFVLVFWTEAILLLFYPASQTYANHPLDEKKTFAKLLHLKEVAFPASSIYVGHAYLRHGGCGGWRSSSLRYHTYLILSSYDPKDVESFPYRASATLMWKPARASGEKEQNSM